MQLSEIAERLNLDLLPEWAENDLTALGATGRVAYAVRDTNDTYTRFLVATDLGLYDVTWSRDIDLPGGPLVMRGVLHQWQDVAKITVSSRRVRTAWAERTSAEWSVSIPAVDLVVTESRRQEPLLAFVDACLRARTAARPGE